MDRDAGDRGVADRISRRLDRNVDIASEVRSESVKHRQAVASVISSVAVAVLYVVVSVDIINTLGLPVGSLGAPAAVLGAALGFGDLVQLTITGSSNDARGTVEDVTLRVTKLRTSDGEVYTVPNGQIVKSLNLSKDWARAVIDIPVPTSADMNRVNEVLRGVSASATDDETLPDLLLDEPSVMGVESIGHPARQAVRGRQAAS
jgi:moderate conductance mechanosensitive channel